MRPTLLLPTLLSAMVTTSTQQIIDKLSFGVKGAISQNSFSIPGWTISGEGYSPHLLSDKVILTPPYGGNKRGALWAEQANDQAEWDLNFEFRANGVDHGKGNFAIWYVKDGNSAVGTSSIYTVNKFEGLALVFDQNNGVQKLRAFLNDGTTDYKINQHVDGLPFGHCDFNYRNLGTPSKIEVKSTWAGLEVTIDGKPCFATTKVSLPAGYKFGMTAASADPPDSIEVFKFVVSQIKGHLSKVDSQQQPPSAKTPQQDAAVTAGSNDAVYKHLDQRLTEIEKTLTTMFAEFNHRTTTDEKRFDEILQLLKSGQSANAAGQGAAIGNLESRLTNLDRSLTSVHSDLKNSLNHDEKFAQISQQLQDTHEGLTQHLPSTIRQYVQNHTPRIGFIVFSFMAFQSCCLAVLLWQKYRKGTMPKKFL